MRTRRGARKLGVVAIGEEVLAGERVGRRDGDELGGSSISRGTWRGRGLLRRGGVRGGRR